MVGHLVNSEGPNPHLSTYKGTIYFGNDKIPVSFRNFLLRGCSLRNTDFVIGCVAYTG